MKIKINQSSLPSYFFKCGNERPDPIACNRTAFVGVMTMGGEVLLGAIPMEDMDVSSRPKLS